MGDLNKYKLVCGKTAIHKVNVCITGDGCTIIEVVTLIILVFIHFINVATLLL
jgi:hypothetical protein